MNQFLGYTSQFWLLCLSTLLFFSSFNMIIPELPAYLTSLGGEEYKGLIISLFTVMAMLSRPISGKLADVMGRKPVMIIGAVVGVGSGFLYPLFSSVFAFLLIRFIHGASTGFNPTGLSAYIADIIPKEKRGSAMGVLGVFTSTGFALGPSIGPFISESLGLDALFYSSSILAFLSLIVIVNMKETLPNPQRPNRKNMRIALRDVFEPQVAAPALYFLLSTYSFGGILTIIPDFTDHLELGNRGLFYTIFVFSSLFVRVIAGKLSDKIGRVKLLKIAAFIIIIALITLSQTTSIVGFVISAILYGLGVGINSPTVFAWTVDLSDESHRGRAMATLYIALEIGIGIGAISMASIYNNQSSQFSFAFISAGVLSVLSFLMLFSPLAVRQSK